MVPRGISRLGVFLLFYVLPLLSMGAPIIRHDPKDRGFRPDVREHPQDPAQDRDSRFKAHRGEGHERIRPNYLEHTQDLDTRFKSLQAQRGADRERDHERVLNPKAYSAPFNLAQLVELRSPSSSKSCFTKMSTQHASSRPKKQTSQSLTNESQVPSTTQASYDRSFTPFYPNDVANLAVARTGSDSITKALQANRQNAHHNHDCTLADMAAVGARRVIVSLRHPAARIVSGFQRRALGQNPSSRVRGDTKTSLSKTTAEKAANLLFVESFVPFGVDEYVSALRLPEHPKHRAAIDATYGKKRQSYMIPLIGFYFGDGDVENSLGLRATTSGGGGEDGNHELVTVEVQFLCTPTLSADYLAAVKLWGLNFRPMPSGSNIHKSTVTSETATHDPNEGGAPHSAPKLEVRDESATFPTGSKLEISDGNKAWLERVYKRDIDLYEKYCKTGHAAAIVPYACPADRSGLCQPA